MANASFHAKITADARQFIQQVEQANQALQELTKSQKAVEGASGAKSAESKKRKEQKGTQQQAEQALEALHRKEMENIKQENQARLQGQKQAQAAIKPKRALLGPENLPANQEAKILRQQKEQASVQRQVIQQKNRIAAETKKQVIQEQKRVALQQKYVQEGKLAFGPLRKQESTMDGLIQSQREQNRLVKEQRTAAAAVARANRDQTEAMITGRYALYDVANLYRQIATGAIQVARASAQAVVSFAEYESAFTAVERAATLDLGSDEFERVREALIDLSTQIPVTFAEISQIATLGAQMGIATGDLAAFTEQIAAFAAVTGNTIDDTAEKFGRLSSLANVPSDQFENLASAVIFAGFNAVATEKEILKMAESIAGAATTAGYSASQIIGLSTALSSLAIPPEQARGVILRLFNDIQRAVDGSSDKIGEFASVMGTTEEAARNLFRTNPEQFFSAFVGGLSEVDNLTAVLDNLGIVETREINVLQRLSGNMDVYTKSLRDANESYTEGTALSEAYADTADNLEAKVQRLINAFEALAATAGAGFGEFLKPIIEGLIAFVNQIENFAATDIGQFVIPIVTSLSAFIAIFAGVTFASKIATAQILALQVAMIKTGQGALTAMNPIAGLTNAIRGTLFATTSASGAMEFYTKKQLDNMVATKAMTAERRAEIIATNQATVATRGLTGAVGILGAAIAAITVIGLVSTLSSLGRTQVDLEAAAGGARTLSDAIKADTEAFRESGEAIALHNTKLDKTSSLSSGAASAASKIVNSQGDVKDAFDDSTQAIDDNTVALGENFARAIGQAVVNTEQFTEMFDSANEAGLRLGETLTSSDLDFGSLIEAAMQDPGSGALDTLREQVQEFLEVTPLDQLDALQQGAGTQQQQFYARLATLLFDVNTGRAVEIGALKRTADEQANANGATRRAIGLYLQQAIAIDGITEGNIAAFEAVQALTAGSQADTEANDDRAESIRGVGKALRDVTDYSKDIGGIFDRIMGIEFGEIEVQDDIADGWEKIAENAEKAEEAIRDANAEILELTADRDVLEYQLSVAQRYGDEQRAAVIRAKLAKIDNKLADENENLAEAQAESEMTLKGTSEAAKENRSALIGLVGEYGNLIQAAIESGMEGEELEGYIRSLKEEFMAQATEVGYSREELEKYEGIFDGFIKTVDKVDPRVDIEFDSNISAAEQALNEYEASLKSINGFVARTTIETKVPSVASQLRPIINGSDVRLFRMGLDRGLISLSDFYKAVYGVDYRTFRTITGQIRGSGSSAGEAPVRFAAGGYVGSMENGGRVRGPGGPTSDSIPTMLSNGEYVVQASAVRSYGVDFMNALNQQRLPMASMPSNATNGVAGGGSNIVYLSPQDRALLRQVADRPVNLYADNGKIAQSANAGNVMLSQRGLN